MKRFLSIAAILIVIGAIAAWLWPAAAPPPAPPPVLLTLPKPAPQEIPKAPVEEEKIRVAFVNHLGNAHLKFTVDGVDICTANAGHSCYGDVRFGKHVVKALEGKKVVRTLNLTLDKKTPNPQVIVCFPTSPNC